LYLVLAFSTLDVFPKGSSLSLRRSRGPLTVVLVICVGQSVAVAEGHS
jgi:plastocyanin